MLTSKMVFIERDICTMSERASAMIQIILVGGHISMIISERSGETYGQINLLATLWAEAVRQAVWHKNRSPSKALKLKKTL